MERKVNGKVYKKVCGETQDSVLNERLIHLLKTYDRVLTERVFITRPGEKGKDYVEGFGTGCCMKDEYNC